MQICGWFVLSSMVLVTAGCREKSEKSPVVPATVESKAGLALEGTRVRIAFDRSVLGLSKDKAISRQTGTYDGVETGASGYVVKDTGQFLVLRRDSVKKEKNEWLEWIPYSSILSISQSPHPTKEEEAASPAEPWQMEAVENLMGMVRFPLRDLPQGELLVWFEKDGKKDLLHGVEIMPGFDQWLYIGVNPIDSNALFLSVVSEESKGFMSVGLHVPRLNPFRKKVEPGHDWKKAAVIAQESSGGGQVWAQVKPKS